MNLADLIPGVRDIVFMGVGALVGASLLMAAALMSAASRGDDLAERLRGGPR